MGNALAMEDKVLMCWNKVLLDWRRADAVFATIQLLHIRTVVNNEGKWEDHLYLVTYKDKKEGNPETP